MSAGHRSSCGVGDGSAAPGPRPPSSWPCWCSVRSSSPTATSGLYRETFLDSLATVAIGLAFVVAAELKGRPREVPGRRPHSAAAHRRPPGGYGAVRRCVPFALSLLLGLTIGLAAITKPTYQWLVLAVAAPLAYPVVQRLRRDRLRWATLLKMALATVLVLSSALGVVETTKQMNQRTYHVNLVEDLSSGALARVWKLWASVEAGRPEKYVPITKAMRTAVYRVSPAAAVLEPTLESPTDGFKLADCYSPLKICNEAGNWFEWDLREAVYSTGGVRSVRGLQTYLNRMADDIARACADGRFRCTSSPVLATGLPPFDAIPKGAVVSYTARGLWQMAWDQLPIRQIASSPATKAQYALWSSVVPSMPSLESLRKGQGVPAEDGVLRVMVVLYGIFNMVLLATLFRTRALASGQVGAASSSSGCRP